VFAFTGHESKSADRADINGVPYNYGSIMHYSGYAFAIDRSKYTIEPKHDGIIIGQREGLTLYDIKEIQLLYGCISPDTMHVVEPYATVAPSSVNLTVDTKGSHYCIRFNIKAFKSM